MGPYDNPLYTFDTDSVMEEPRCLFGYGIYFVSSVFKYAILNLFLQLLFQENNPGVRYEYVIPKDSSENEVETVYTWKYGMWSDCSASCGAGNCISNGEPLVH